MTSPSLDDTLPMDVTVEVSDEEVLELELDDTIPIVRTILDSDEEISETELSEATNYATDISFSPVWQNSPEQLRTEQKSKSSDSSIKVLCKVIN